MPRKPTATGPDTADAPTAIDAARLLQLVRDDRIDAAIEAGLMRHVPSSADIAIDADGANLLARTRLRLQAAWDARERHRARAARLQRREAERDARRTRVAAPALPIQATQPGPAVHATPATSTEVAAQPTAATPASCLPSGAAAILARAKARAAARGTPS